MNCRYCNMLLTDVFIDLGNAPPSNSFLDREQLNCPETFYPLKVFVCRECFLVQVDEYKTSESIFGNEYVYFSSYSRSWLQHASNYVDKMMEQFHLNEKSLVVEVASNDGYLLQYFQKKKVPVLGIEPAAGTAKVALSRGIKTMVDFFGADIARKLSEKGIHADLLLGNNVLAHVPDIRDFVSGMKILLEKDGIITMEFPHLMQLVEKNQFDTIYHEHFSYLSFYTVKSIFGSFGLDIFDVEELATHGGSLRIYAKHKDNLSKTVSARVSELLAKEESRGMNTLGFYQNFQKAVLKVKIDFVSFLLRQKAEGRKVVGYGAAAKGNTLLNYCGIKNDLIDYVVDANPHKQNKFLPASHIPVENEERLKTDKPDFVVIFPWNLRDEIVSQLSYIRGWGGKFVIPIPNLEIF